MRVFSVGYCLMSFPDILIRFGFNLYKVNTLPKRSMLLVLRSKSCRTGSGRRYCLKQICPCSEILMRGGIRRRYNGICGRFQFTKSS